jgi:hypothetical protein
MYSSTETTNLQTNPQAEAPLEWDTDAASFRSYRWTNPKTQSLRVRLKRRNSLMITSEDKKAGSYWGMPVVAELPERIRSAEFGGIVPVGYFGQQQSRQIQYLAAR